MKNLYLELNGHCEKMGVAINSHDLTNIMFLAMNEYIGDKVETTFLNPTWTDIYNKEHIVQYICFYFS